MKREGWTFGSVEIPEDVILCQEGAHAECRKDGACLRYQDRNKSRCERCGLYAACRKVRVEVVEVKANGKD
jgi:hypothetical protein